MKAPPWTEDEIEILRTVYATQGLVAAAAQLPNRTPGSIYVKANKLRILTTHRRFRQGCYRQWSEQAWQLRQTGMSFAMIGVEMGCTEATATNAVYYADCVKAGRRPAERDSSGKLKPEGIERLRVMLRKGWTGREIQQWLGLPSATITRERRRYEKELKAKGLAPLPPYGNGKRYSGARIPKDTAKEVVRLYMEGYGTKTVTTRTGVSNTHCLRTRARLIKKLKRKGECLPGCDINGKRLVMKDHVRCVPEHSLKELKKLLLTGKHSIMDCGRMAGVGGSTAYRIFHELEAEHVAAGKVMPRRKVGGKRDKARSIPGGAWGYCRYRELLRTRPATVARRMVEDEWAAKIQANIAAIEEARQRKQREEAEAKRLRALSLEEQIALIEKGKATLMDNRPFRNTLGGAVPAAL